jgi:hypothetical protein
MKRMVEEPTGRGIESETGSVIVTVTVHARHVVNPYLSIIPMILTS